MRCVGCDSEDVPITKSLGLCAGCLRSGVEKYIEHAAHAHQEVRSRFPVPAMVPRADEGIQCSRCTNSCVIAEGEQGFCGVRRVRGGRLLGGNAGDGYLRWYLDPMPTNCVADWVCPGGTGVGYPRYANTDGSEYGFFNLAVFCLGCTFDCLFCQNWQCREIGLDEPAVPARRLAGAVGENVSCICYFGGDPTPQIHHALAAARLARKQRGDGILRICWETNGAMSPELLEQMIGISMESGGCIKFDLKAWDGNLHKALTGVSNSRTLENVDLIAGRIGERPEPPMFVASTLLVPGYVDADEVGAIAGFLARRSPDIPYALLAFAPQFAMSDLPATSRAQATRCLQAARDAGLTRVRLGNEHLLR